MNLKLQVYTKCREVISERIGSLQQSLKDLIESAANETKSTAGDKYETARAMLHIEQDTIRRQLFDAQAQQAVLESIDPATCRETVGCGSLVRMSGAYYFLSTALGKLEVNDLTVIALSMQSPLGSKMAGLRVGDRVEMNGRELVIEELT